MPESVTDRPTKSHSYVFLLAKQPRYFCDLEAVSEPHQYGRRDWNGHVHVKGGAIEKGHDGDSDRARDPTAGRNVRSVWNIATQPFSASALPGGVRHKASPDCPVHGDRAALAAMQSDGERAGTPSPRTPRSDIRPGQEPLSELVPTGPPLEPGSVPSSSDSPGPGSSQPASGRSTQSHKTSSRSDAGGTAFEEIDGRRLGSEPAYESPAPDGCDSPEASETADGTSDRCTCNPAIIDHFATFPEELARRCILAGTSERGCCPECGAPWIRQTESTLHPVQKTFTHTAPRDGFHKNPEGHIPAKQTVETTGWRLACTHDGHQPCVVLDPFVGSGTVPYVARKHGRHAIGIDLSASYLELAARRLQQLSLFA